MTSTIGFFPIFIGFSSSGSDPTAPSDRIVMVNPSMFFGGGGSGGEGGVPPASRKSIEGLKTVADVAEDGAECAVCLEELEKGKEAKEMPCGHRFHGDCIGKWLGMHGSCPVCRYRMPEEEAAEQSKDREEEEGRRTRREVRVTIIIGRETTLEERTQLVADDVD